MNYPVAYNNSGSVSGSLSKGNINVFISSSVTTTFQGKTFGPSSDIPSGGMLIIGNNNTNPLFWPINDLSNSASILDTVNKLPDRYNQVPFSNTSSALQYLVSSNKYFPLVGNEPLPNITTGEDVLFLDAGLFASYPETGSIWYNLSGNTYTGSLTNNPTFNSEGYFTFDGTDDWVNFGPSASALIQGKTNITIGLLFQSNTNLVLRSLFGTLRYGCGRNLGLVSSFNNLVFYNDYGGPEDPGGVCYAVGFSNYVTASTWIYAAATYDGTTTRVYGIKQGALSLATGTAKSGSTNVFSYNLEMGRGGFGQYLNGRVANAFIYNRTLTQQEILQNYYQAPIVTDGLVFAVDAGNLVSYESGSTTTYSLTGSLSGSLINGTGFSNVNGGSWVFDGVDDYITFGTSTLITTDFTIENWFSVNDALKEHYLINIGYNSLSSLLLTINTYGNGTFSADAYYRDAAGTVVNYSMGSGITEKIHHIVLTRSGATNIAYINGITTNTFNNSTTLASNLNLQLGWAIPRSKSSAYLQGNIFNSRIYNRALSAAEVAQNFKAQQNRFI